MPLYDYECEKCKHVWEVEKRITDESKEKCPKCKSGKTKRLICGRTGFILTGKGWSRDGYT